MSVPDTRPPRFEGAAPLPHPASHRRRSPVTLVAVVCAAEILGMAPLAMFLASQPRLAVEWQLSNTTSGWIASAYYGGYMLAVPALASLTDRLDARVVWLGATALGAIAVTAFGLLADGVWPAVVCQALAGASLAGTYMPGLKLLDDRIPGALPPRIVAFYTTSFTLGSSASYFVVGLLTDALPWRLGLATVAIGPVIAWVLVWLAVHPVAVVPRPPEPAGDQWRDVLRSRDTMRYVIAYGCHMWELFGMRAWLVPFLTFCAARHGGTVAAPTTLAALVALAGMPASFGGAELSTRVDRRRLVVAIMLLSAATGVLFGVTATWGWAWILIVGVVYHALVMGDSAALTSGLVATAPLERRGTAMALYSLTGFAAASAGSFAVGVVLDGLGGQSVVSWRVAFLVVGAMNLIGVWVLRRADRAPVRPPPRLSNRT